MPMKDALNNTLRRTTGYHLTRETPEQRRAEIANAKARAERKGRQELAEFKAKVQRDRDERKARQEARQQELQAERAARKKASDEARAARQAVLAKLREERDAARAASLRDHLDPQARATIARVMPWTMTGGPKLEALIEAVRHIERRGIAGEIVECGVWRGGSMQAIALTLMEQGNTERELHLYDTFTGMSEPTAEDVRIRDGEARTAAQMLAESDKDAQVWAVAGIDVVREGMESTGYPVERIHYHPGMVEDTIPDQAPQQIALLRLDTDWYASTRHELEHLWDRLTPGGILLIDDYGDWEGARKAVDEWLEKSGLTLFLAPMGPGRVAMKPLQG